MRFFFGRAKSVIFFFTFCYSLTMQEVHNSWHSSSYVALPATFKRFFIFLPQMALCYVPECLSHSLQRMLFNSCHGYKYLKYKTAIVVVLYKLLNWNPYFQYSLCCKRGSSENADAIDEISGCHGTLFREHIRICIIKKDTPVLLSSVLP